MSQKKIIVGIGSETVEAEIVATYNPRSKYLNLHLLLPGIGKTFSNSSNYSPRRAGIKMKVRNGMAIRSLQEMIDRAHNALENSKEKWFRPFDNSLDRDETGGYGAQLDLNPLPQILERVVQDYIKEYKGGKAG